MFLKLEAYAFKGTPVLDLKPYIKSSDCVPEAEASEFIKKDENYLTW